MNLAEMKMRLELAAKHKPALRKLLDGNIQNPEDLAELADATADLGQFELSFLLRAVAKGGADFEQNLAKLTLFVSSVADRDLLHEFAERVGDEGNEIVALLRLFGGLER